MLTLYSPYIRHLGCWLDLLCMSVVVWFCFVAPFLSASAATIFRCSAHIWKVCCLLLYVTSTTYCQSASLTLSDSSCCRIHKDAHKRQLCALCAGSVTSPPWGRQCVFAAGDAAQCKRQQGGSCQCICCCRAHLTGQYPPAILFEVLPLAARIHSSAVLDLACLQRFLQPCCTMHGAIVMLKSILLCHHHMSKY